MGIMENKMETMLGLNRGSIGLYWVYIGIMEKRMEETI